MGGVSAEGACQKGVVPCDGEGDDGLGLSLWAGFSQYTGMVGRDPRVFSKGSAWSLGRANAQYYDWLKEGTCL